MGDEDMKKVLFFSIFLIMMNTSFNMIYGNTTYEVGQNTVEREIVFELSVEDSVLVIPESVNLDFGKILKGSTETRSAETKINVEAGDSVQSVRATYEDIGELQLADNSRKIQITRKAEEVTTESKELNIVPANPEGVGTETIDVYMLPFEQSYPLAIVDNKNQGEILVKGEIRGIGDAIVGNYEGIIRVNVEIVTSNN